MNELTLNQIEKMREAAGEKIAGAIYDFEKLTGLSVIEVILVPYYQFNVKFAIPGSGNGDMEEDKTQGRKLLIKFRVSI